MHVRRLINKLHCKGLCCWPLIEKTCYCSQTELIFTRLTVRQPNDSRAVNNSSRGTNQLVVIHTSFYTLYNTKSILFWSDLGPAGNGKHLHHAVLTQRSLLASLLPRENKNHLKKQKLLFFPISCEVAFADSTAGCQWAMNGVKPTHNWLL